MTDCHHVDVGAVAAAAAAYAVVAVVAVVAVAASIPHPLSLSPSLHPRKYPSCFPYPQELILRETSSHVCHSLD